MSLPLVLASKSPRRSEILRQLAVPFEVDPANVNEAMHAAELPNDYVRRMAREKAVTVAERHAGRHVLGSDTVVVVEGRVLTKPSGDEDATSMLKCLGGRTHEVVTAVAVVRDARVVGETAVSTRVSFRDLGSDEIGRYVALGEGRDKAGAYAIQGVGAGFVARIEGSYHGVVGLPAAETVSLLRSAGLLSDWP